MPFYAKDWRSPGESWIKTQDGWEKLKILECRQNSFDSSNFNRSIDVEEDKENCTQLDNTEHETRKNMKSSGTTIPPHCQITLKITKEVAGFNGLSDALRRLDFRSAVHDHRRFPYTAKLLELLLSQQRITTLSGLAQKSVLNVLEEIAVQAQASNQNVHVLAKLLSDLRRIVRGDSWWGQPLGSSQLWGKHVQTIDRIGAIASSIRSAENTTQDGGNITENNKPKFEDLPEECVREILFRLADHRDLLSAAEACSVAQKLSAEHRLWKRLCRFHFSPLQINFVLSEMQKERDKPPVTVPVLPTSPATPPCPLNNVNKINRNNRTPHPYLQGNNPRRSPSRVQSESDANPEEILDNEGVDTIRGRVSNAFHEHLNRHRDSLLSLQHGNSQETTGQNANHNRLLSFQDVRNHFDQLQPLDNQPDTRRVTSKRINDNKTTRTDSKEQVFEDDWEEIYHRARRLFGLREDYAEILHLCRTCRCLFWKTYGHPCIATANESVDPEAYYVPVPPQAFLKFFSL